MIIKEQRDLKFLQLQIFDIDFRSGLDDGHLSYIFVYCARRSTCQCIIPIYLCNIREDV